MFNRKEFIGFHRGWDGLVHVVTVLFGYSVTRPDDPHYECACHLNIEGPESVSLTIAIVGRSERPAFTDGPATCLDCLAAPP